MLCVSSCFSCWKSTNVCGAWFSWEKVDLVWDLGQVLSVESFWGGGALGMGGAVRPRIDLVDSRLRDSQREAGPGPGQVAFQHLLLASIQPLKAAYWIRKTVPYLTLTAVLCPRHDLRGCEQFKKREMSITLKKFTLLFISLPQTRLRANWKVCLPWNRAKISNCVTNMIALSKCGKLHKICHQ